MKLLTFAAVLAFAALQVYSQKQITLNEAIMLAKQYNSDYKIAMLDKLKAERKVSEVYSENLVPSVTLSSRYIRSFKKQVINIFGQTFEIGTDNNFSTTLDVSEPIPILGTPVMNGIKIAKYYSELQDENVTLAESKLKTQVKKSFYAVLLLKEVVGLNQQSLESSQENLRVVEARNRAGVALEFDVIRAKVRVETIRPQLTQAENNLTIARKYLKNTIGTKDGQEFDAVGSLVYDSTEVWDPTENIISSISEKNVSIRQLNLTKKINEELNNVDHANYLPKIYLFGQYQLTANENDNISLSKYKFFNSYSAGIGLSWDLNLFRNSYKEDQSLIEIKKTEERIAQVKELLKVQSESTILKLEDAKNRIKAQKDVLMQAERGLELAMVSYKNGVLNQIDVVDAELGLRQVQLAYLQAIYDYLLARTELEELLEK